MPSGHSKTERVMPKIPGSREAGDNPSRNGAACLTAAEIWRQRAYHTKRITRNPQSHVAARSAGSRWIRLGEAIEGVAREIVGCVKGWLTCSIAKYKPAFVPAV